MSTFAPSRLTIARKRRGITKKTLADRAIVSTRSLTAYENGDQEPTLPTLRRIADALSFPIDFFSGPELEPPPRAGISFRSLTKLTARQRDQAIQAATFALAFSDWMDAHFKLPVPSIPELLHDTDSPEAAAEAVRGAWSLGERPAPNMVHLLEAHGVRVFSLPEESLDIDAFSFWREGRPFVFLNTRKSAERSRMDAAHELGHIVMHRSHHIPRGREAEAEAQAFGSAFLMPRGSVLALAPRTATLDHLIRAKRHWNVALANLAYRMHVVGLLTDWQYRSLFIAISDAGYRTNEPASSSRESSQVLAKVFGALRADGVRTSDISTELAIPVDELTKLVFGLVLTRIAGGVPQTSPTKPSLDQPQLHLLRNEPPAVPRG